MTASHELLEMLGDPEVNDVKGIYASPNGQGRLYACEMCDPVEADALGYTINGVQVSDFILPSYFLDGEPGPFDFKGHLSGPLTLAPGGYQSYLDMNSPAGWQQMTQGEPELVGANMGVNGHAAAGNPRTTAQPGSRRERRQRKARDNVRRAGGFPGWQRSTVAVS